LSALDRLAANDGKIRNSKDPDSFVERKPTSNGPKQQAVNSKDNKQSNEHSHKSQQQTLPPSGGDLVSWKPSSSGTPVLLGTSLKSEMLLNMQLLCQQLGGGCRVQNEYNSAVTHVVAAADESRLAARTLKYLLAVADGRWVVSFDWILACRREKRWVNEEPFEILSDGHASGAPKKSRLAHAVNPIGLMNGYSVYLYGRFTSPSRAELEHVCECAGSVLLHALPSKDVQRAEQLWREVIIVERSQLKEEDCRSLVEQSGRSPLSVDWLLDALSHYELPPAASYRVSSGGADVPITQHSQPL